MTLVSSGPISLGGNTQANGLNQSIQFELYQAGLGSYNASGTATISMNDAVVRNLAGKPTGAVTFADFYGKSAVIYYYYTVSSANYGVFPPVFTLDSSGQQYVAYQLYDGSSTYTAATSLSGANAAVSWSKAGGSGGYGVYDIVSDLSSSLYITGSYGGSNQRYLLKRNASTGAISWTRYWNPSTPTSTYFNYVAATASNVYVSETGYDVTNYIIRLLKTDTSGTVQWYKKLSSGSVVSNSICLDSSENIYISGYDVGVTKGYLACLTSAGAISWQKLSSTVISFGGSTVSGTSFYAVAGGYVFKFDLSGNLIWQRSISSVYLRRAVVGADGYIYVVGDSGTQEGVIIKVDSSGNLQWQRGYNTNAGSGNTIYARSIAVSGTSVYAGFYYTDSFNDNPGYYIKVPTDGSKTGTVYYATSYAWTTPSISFTNASRTIANDTYTTSTASLSDTDITTTVTKTNL